MIFFFKIMLTVLIIGNLNLHVTLANLVAKLCPLIPENQEYNYEEHYDHYYDSCRAQ